MSFCIDIPLTTQKWVVQIWDSGSQGLASKPSHLAHVGFWYSRV